MTWLRRPFTLPILLGLSLTSVSIAVLYVLFKKDEEDIKTRKKNIEVAKRTSIECKVPRQFVPAVIGRGGSMIKEIQNKTGTQIQFKEDNIECPDRICTIRGSYAAVHLAEEMIKSVIQNQPIIETYEMYVPQKACRKIIGRGGEVIQQIQAISNAKIIIEKGYTPYDPNAEKRIIIRGTTEQIAAALSRIEDKIREEKKAHTALEASSTARLPRGKLSPRNTIVNASESIPEPSSLPVIDSIVKVYVSAMKNPNQFWIQVIGPGTRALDKLMCEMTAYYNDEQNHELHTLRSITPGQIVAAKFSLDQQWYRAQVMSAPEDDQCEVYFADYGNHEVVQLAHVLELRTDFLSLRLQAVECSLADIKPKENEWSSEVCERFTELTGLAQKKVLTAKVSGYKERALGYGRFRREGSPIPCVDLFDMYYDKDICTSLYINRELVDEGLAEPEGALLTFLSLPSSTRSHNVTITPRPASTSPLAKRAPSPETSVNTSRKLDSTIDSPNISVTDLDTSKDVPLHPQVEEINISPHKPSGQIEEIDLVTPVKEETSRFIETERKVHREDGAGDYLRNGSSNQHGKFKNSQFKISKSSRVAPAGYESDVSDDSDELELG